MPKSKTPSERGDLILTFDVTYPTTISSEAKEKIKQALPRT